MNVTNVSNKVRLGKGGKRRTPNETVHTLSAKDVVLGRGHHVRQTGNHDFVQLVRANAVEYTTCESKGGKDAIARRIMRYIQDQGGRFVRQTSPPRDRALHGVNEAIPVWEIADEKAVLIKVKQTFRDYSASLRKAAARRGEGRIVREGASPVAAIRAPVEARENDASVDPSLNVSFAPVEAPAPVAVAATGVVGEPAQLAQRDQLIQLLHDVQHQYQQHQYQQQQQQHQYQQQQQQQQQRQQLFELVARVAPRIAPPLAPTGASTLLSNVVVPSSHPVPGVAVWNPSTLSVPPGWPTGLHATHLPLNFAAIHSLVPQGWFNHPSHSAATLELLQASHGSTRQPP